MATSREQEIEAQATDILREAGFPYVQEQPRVASVGRPIHADLLVWDVDETGALAPRFVVEVKARRRAPDAAITHQVAGFANALGVREAYFFNGETWFAFDPTFRNSAPTTVPRPSFRETHLEPPGTLIREAVAAEAFRTLDKARAEGVPPSDYPIVALRRLRDLQDQGTSPLGRFLQHQSARWVAVETVVEEVLARVSERLGGWAETPPWSIAQVMARLVDAREGHTVLDPYCRTAATLLAAAQGTSSLKLKGIHPQPAAIDIARDLFRLGGVEADLRVGSFLGDGSSLDADSLVCAPPFGVRLHEPASIATGEATLDGDLLLLDRIAKALRPGGRAVVMVLPKVLFQGGACERLRAHLQQTLWVAAVVSLPANVLQPSTSVAPVLLVLQRSAPRPTLVAQLGDDWQLQLSDQGEFMRAYREHVGAA